MSVRETKAGIYNVRGFPHDTITLHIGRVQMDESATLSDFNLEADAINHLRLFSPP